MKLKAFFASLALGALALMSALPSLAGPLPYVTSVFDTPNATVNQLVTSLNTTSPSFATVVAGSGTTTVTASGLRTLVSITGLTTAAGVTSATVTVTNTSVTAASMVFCMANGYAGTGNPMPVNVVPAAGSFTFAIQNTHASAALNATVPVACLVYN